MDESTVPILEGDVLHVMERTLEGTRNIGKELPASTY